MQRLHAVLLLQLQQQLHLLLELGRLQLAECPLKANKQRLLLLLPL
jgi:hypothetical protein